MKHFSNLIRKSFFIFLILISLNSKIKTATISPGKSVVTNECGSLGQNNPLSLLDCSIFKLDKGMCCLLTITRTSTDEDDGVLSNEEYFLTACIVLQKINAQIINETTQEFKSLGGDLIECSQLYIYKSFILISFIFNILIF